MNRKLFTFLLLFVLLGQNFAQVVVHEKKLKKVETVKSDSLAGWKTGGVTSLSFTQIAFKDWATGGENSMALNGLFSVFANYKDKNNSWENTLDLGYGILKQKTYKSGYMKTDDRIDFMSKYGRKAFRNFYYTGLINFKSQFSEGYNYPNDSTVVSDFLAPGYFMGAIGLNYQPNSYFSVFVAPVSTKMTIVLNDELSNQGAFGVESGEKFRAEMGGYSRIAFQKADFKHPLLKNVSLTTKLSLFSNYLDKPQNVDINWETLIAMKVNKYISVSLNTILVYDDDVKINGKKSAGLQLKEILGVGLSYNF